MTEETKQFIKMKSLKSDKLFQVFLDPDFDSLEEYRSMIKLL